MPFDTALSGIRAASTNLSVTGSNIANASTNGFKVSRTEFGDVYANSVLGAGSNNIGAGVQVQDVSQSFAQGNVAFTENELDMAINGNGFFIVSRGGEQLYTRAGTFGLDDDGFITNNIGARLQGFEADTSGNVGGVIGDVQIQTANLAPRQTTDVESVLNLNSTNPVLQSVGRSFNTSGNAIGVAQAGLQTSTTTTLTGTTFGLPLANNFSPAPTGTPMSFEVQFSGSATGNNGSVDISLDTDDGVPATVNTFNDLRTLAGVINAQIFSPAPPQTPVDVVANAVDYGGGVYGLEFTALQEGENTQIQINSPSANAAQIGISPAPASVAGIAAVSNGYPQQSIDFVDGKGQSVTYTSLAGASAAQTASELNALQGVSATSNTNLTITGFNSSADNMTVSINGVQLTGDSLATLEAEINSLSNTILPGISATLDPTATSLSLQSVVGDDLRISIASTDGGDSLSIQGDPDAPAQVLQVPPVSAGNFDSTLNSVVVGGTINLVLAEDYVMQNETPPSVGLFQPISDTEFSDVVLNAFDPNDQSTYNSATSMSIYDSLGNSHVLTQYFVKEHYEPTDLTTAANHWSMYVQIDGQDVGDPNTALPSPQNTQPTTAKFDVYFREDGSLNTTLTEDMLISNWTPLDSNGMANGAMGPQNVLAGGTTVIPDPPVSSNFVVDLTGTTQFGSEFSVNDVDQNGFATGRLSGLSIDESGVIFARYTNGESQILAQVALADFTNQQGLQPVGNTMWAENFESGAPNVGTPRSAALGSLQAGALEESNVDLSEQLVNLIIAQRNFQASAKTIETADQVTQTIINLR